MDVLFNGLLAELPASLDNFYQYHKCFTNTASAYIGVVGRGWWGATIGGLRTCQVIRLPNGPSPYMHALDATTKSSQING